MIDILRPEGSNPGGTLSLEYTPIYAPSGFPINKDSLIDEVVPFKAGFRFYKIEVIEDKLDYECEPKETDAGQLWTVKISGTVRGDSLSLKRQLSKMAICNAFIVKAKDNAGLTVLVGNLTEKLRFTYKKRGGGGMSSLRSYDFTFSQTFTEEPPVYTA